MTKEEKFPKTRPSTLRWPPGRTPNLEISPTEQPVKSTDDSPRQTPPAQMIIPETQPDDSEPMTISMEPVEPNLGEVEPMETDKTSDHLKVPTVPQNKRFKPTMTPQNLDLPYPLSTQETI
ncbi:hypothetical protein OUZ56_024213 [Daphnia magna]|uniref:Uncharacterized protein n=1 Tax=Daphnia magna TaxID=35525 RepID=A0ABR0B100_9CRUS|nr:hypothetical protein OUZ56_024213 [Daphnia magna]